MNLRVIFEPFYKHSTLLHQEVLILDGYPECKMLFYIPMIVFNCVTDFFMCKYHPAYYLPRTTQSRWDIGAIVKIKNGIMGHS